MGLDIRFPIAFLFALLGGLLVLFGAASDPSIYMHSLGINVNLHWGAALLLFGVGLWLAAARAAKRVGENRESSGRFAGS